MNKFSYLIMTGLIVSVLGSSVAFAGSCEIDKNKPRRGEITLKSSGAGVASLIIPGVGQYINDEPKGKVVTHAVAGFLLPGVIHLFSAYDALFDREGGYWKGRI